MLLRSASFKEDEGTWRGNDDGKVVNNQPQRVMDERSGIGAQGGYIAKYDYIKPNFISMLWYSKNLIEIFGTF